MVLLVVRGSVGSVGHGGAGGCGVSGAVVLLVV